jgi:hypothetical protein
VIAAQPVDALEHRRNAVRAVHRRHAGSGRLGKIDGEVPSSRGTKWNWRRDSTPCHGKPQICIHLAILQ